MVSNSHGEVFCSGHNLARHLARLFFIQGPEIYVIFLKGENKPDTVDMCTCLILLTLFICIDKDSGKLST